MCVDSSNADFTFIHHPSGHAIAQQVAVDVSLGRPGFDPRPVLLGFLANKSGNGIGFSLTSLFSPVSITPLM